MCVLPPDGLFVFLYITIDVVDEAISINSVPI